MTDFSTISATYRENSLAQASAGKLLIELLAPAHDADILDVACGPGNLTAELKGLTSGRVVGIDQAEGMIRQARERYAELGIDFRQLEGNRMPFVSEFDCVFCNSAFQWFAEPAAVLAGIHRALRPGGRVAMQAPATRNYCPNFIRAIDHCRRSAEMEALFAGFRSPWFFLESAVEYRSLFEQAGFTVGTCRIDPLHQPSTPEKAFAIFTSGAAAGYLNQAYFAEPLPDDFTERVLQGVRDSFAEQASAEGVVDLIFHRIFVVAHKTADRV